MKWLDELPQASKVRILEWQRQRTMAVERAISGEVDREVARAFVARMTGNIEREVTHG